MEPTVEEAKNAVKGIKKSQLVELRSMNSPPNVVKLALESICLLLGEDVGSDWKPIRAAIIKDDFISRILQFDTDLVSAKTKSAMEVYEKNPDWDFEKVYIFFKYLFILDKSSFFGLWSVSKMDEGAISVFTYSK